MIDGLLHEGGGGWCDINDNNFLLNITVDIKVVLFTLTHAGFILTWFVNFKTNVCYAFFTYIVMYVPSSHHMNVL